MFNFNFYTRLKEKYKNNLRQNEYINNGICDLASLFDANVDDVRFIDIIKMSVVSGGAIISKNKSGNFEVWEGSSASRVRQNGDWDKVTGFAQNGETFKGTNGIDCAVIHFNPFREMETPIFRFADLLTECDISIDANVMYSRYNPIMLCEDDTIKASIEHALNNIKIGKPITILSKRLMKRFTGEKSDDVSILNITDVKNSDKIQYLSEYHDSLLRRLYTKYGCPLSSSTKHAQVNSDEISGAESVSKLYITQILEELKRGFDNVNNTFGTNWTIEFSDIIKNVGKESNDNVSQPREDVEQNNE